LMGFHFLVPGFRYGLISAIICSIFVVCWYKYWLQSPTPLGDQSNLTSDNSMSHVGVSVRWGLDWMIGFIAHLHNLLLHFKTTIWHTMSSLHHLQLPSKETPSILILAAWDHHYIVLGQTHKKQRSFLYLTVSTGMCLHHPATGCLSRICCSSNGVVTLLRLRGNMFTEPLPSNGRILWLHDSCRWASCNSIKSLS
jgi:hypothetical protein